MTKKRRESSRPKKLTDFFGAAGHGTLQDGGGSSPSSPRQSSPGGAPSETARSEAGSSADGNQDSHAGSGSPALSSPSTRSPAKSRPRMSPTAETRPKVSSPAHVGGEKEDFADFPVSNNSLSESTMKEMLVSLRGSLHADMQSMIGQFKTELHQMGGRVSHIESKMGEFALTFNELVDSHNAKEDDLLWVKAKLADLEDRSRRNNLKIRGIPETVRNEDLLQYVQTMLAAALPDLPATDLIIDRIHRLPKPAHIPDNLPRDVLLRIHFFHTKDRFLQLARNASNLPQPYTTLQFYADLSQQTLGMRRRLNPITKALRNHNLVYRWGYPTKLLITRDSKLFSVTSLEEGLTLLKSWNIIPPEERIPQPTTMNTEWRTVTRKKKQKQAS